MSCMWILKNCTQLDKAESKEEPLVDLTKVLETLAWETIRKDPPRRLTWTERLCKFEKIMYVEVDKSFISIQHPDTLTLTPRSTEPTNADLAMPAPNLGLEATTVLFQSHFQNDTESKQTYSFKTERQTRSMAELSLQRGFTIGNSLGIDAKIPTGIKGCKVSGKLGAQLQWTFNRSKISREEEHVTWAVDNHVEVSPFTTGVATLGVNECRWQSDFSLECIIRPRPRSSVGTAEPDSSESEDEGRDTIKIPVFVRRKATGDLLQVVNVPCSAVCAAYPSHFKPISDDPSAFLCVLRGSAHVVCAVNQKVWLREARLVGDVHEDGIVMKQITDS